MERNNHVTLGAATRFLTLCIPHSIKPRVKVSHIPCFFFLKYIRENIPFEVVKMSNMQSTWWKHFFLKKSWSKKENNRLKRLWDTNCQRKKSVVVVRYFCWKNRGTMPRETCVRRTNALSHYSQRNENGPGGKPSFFSFVYSAAGCL